MDAPTEWTFDGQLDWSSADSLRLAPVGLVLQTIIEAIKERREAISFWFRPELPSVLSNEFNPLLPVKIYIDAIQTAMTGLMNMASLHTPWVAFVNHTDHGGDWTGQTQIPAWTEADMLAAIGAEERFVLYPLSPLSSKWFYQQYQLLNLMRWMRHCSIYETPKISTKGGSGHSLVSLSDAWNKAVADYEGEAWGTTGYYSMQANSSTGDGTDNWSAQIGVLRWEYIDIINNSDFAVDMVCYVAGDADGGDESVFYQGIPGVSLNFCSLSVLIPDTPCPANTTTRIDGMTPNYVYPGTPATGGYCVKTCRANAGGNTSNPTWAESAYVYKFDVPGGFKFIA